IAARSGDNGDGISESDILGMLQTMIRQRRDSIEQFKQGGRKDLADKEAEEIAVIQDFLPAQLDEGEVGEACRQVVAELEAGGTFDARRAECDAQIRNRRRRRVAGEAALDTHRTDLFAFILGAAQQLGEGGEARIGEVEGEVVASAAGKIGEIAGVDKLSFLGAHAGPAGAPIQIRLLGRDIDVLRQGADELKAK
ncbi:MAG: GatB/YqeY domain-containing protein, partial [Alphaproteobacteria bacterium]|nr:GatB/YqeY domain-containing protein [Alphaproteobacteria bacterium]